MLLRGLPWMSLSDLEPPFMPTIVYDRYLIVNGR